MARGALARAKKKAADEGYTILFVDESAFYLLPGVVRTWAPIGETPILRHKLTRDHLSVISAVTPEGKLFLRVQEESFNSVGIIGFLEQLQQQITDKLLIIWDGAPIHRSKLIQEYLAGGAATRLHLERLPGYAPDLNPDEGVWNYFKHVELKNVCCPDIAHLQRELSAAEQRLRHKSEIIQACFEQAGYY